MDWVSRQGPLNRAGSLSSEVLALLGAAGRFNYSAGLIFDPRRVHLRPVWHNRCPRTCSSLLVLNWRGEERHGASS